MDPTFAAAIGQEMLRMQAIGNASLLASKENSERLSAMMGIRAAQANPIEANSISTLNNSAGANNSLITALAAAMMNLAHGTPNPYTFVPQSATMAAKVA